MIITSAWLTEKGACSEGKEWFSKQREKDAVKVIKKLIKADHLQWANWLIVRVMDYKQYVSYAVFAAEQVVDIYEKKYPEDKRPRQAIEAAKKCVENPSAENKKSAAADADAAYAAYAAAYAAADADAAYAAYAAAYAAADADAAARKKMQLRILEYGLTLLKAEPKGENQ